MPTNLEKIKALQAKLKAVQAKKLTEKLSERSMIEIVSKLSNLKLVDLIISTDGKDYITPNFLNKQILESVNIYGNGRLAISDICEHVKVEFSTVERFVHEIIEGNRGLYFLINNQLISSVYFQNILAEIMEMVEFKGRLPFPNIALHYDLPLEILSKQLLPLIKKDSRNFTIQNEPDTVIYAEKYQNLAKAKITGCLNAICYPVNISEILKICDLDKNFDIRKIIQKYLLENQSKSEIQGKGPSAVFIPEKYVQAQTDWILNTFRSNLFIDYNSLAKIGIPANKQKNLAKETISAGFNHPEHLIYTNNGIVDSDSLFADLEAQLFETEKVLVLDNIMPDFIELDEYQDILNQFMDLDNFMLVDNMVFKKDYVNNQCFDLFQETILRAAEQEAEKRYKSGHTVSVIATDNKPATKSGNNKKKGKGKKGKGKKQAQDDFSDSDNEQTSSNLISDNFLPNTSELISILKKSDKITEDFQNFEHEFYLDSETVFKLIVSHLSPKITAKYEELSNNLLSQIAEKKNAMVKNFSKNLQDRIHQNLVLSRLAYSGVRLIHKTGADNSKNLAESCEAHLLQKMMQEVYDNILILASGIGPNDISFEIGQILTVKDRKMLTNGLPNSLREVFAQNEYKIFSGILENSKVTSESKKHQGGSDKDKKGKKNNKKSSQKNQDDNNDEENTPEIENLTFEDHLENLLILVNNSTLCLNRVKIDKKQDKNFIENFFISQTENTEILSILPYHDRLTFLTIRAFYVITRNNFIFVSGKNVPNLISFLSFFAMKESAYDNLLDLLISCKDTIMDKLKDGSISESDEKLEENLKILLEILKNCKISEVEASPGKMHVMKTRGDRQRALESISQDTQSQSQGDDDEDEIVVVDKPKARRRNRRAD